MTAEDAPLAASAPGDDDASRDSLLREEGLMAAEISAVVGFAIVSPVLGSFGDSAETFVASEASRSDIIAFGLVVALGPLVALAGAGALTRVLGPTVRGWVQTVLVSTLAAMAAVVVARDAGAATATRTVVFLAVAGAVGLVHRRWEAGRSFLRFASPTPLLFLVLFLFASSVTPLLDADADAGAGEARTGDHPPVVMIVLDELPTLSLVRQGEIDAGLFPTIARLAGTSTWYRNHTTVAPATLAAVPSLVTGTIQGDSSTAAVAATYPDSLFSLLAPTHDVASVEYVTRLCPSEECDGPDPDLTDEATALLTRPISEATTPLLTLSREARSLWWGQAWPTAATPTADNEVTALDDPSDLALPGLEFLSRLAEPSDGPSFAYLHAPVPHQPWNLLPSGETYDAPAPPRGMVFFSWPSGDQGENVALAARSRHLLQLQWTDRLLGAIFDRLQADGRWDDAVVVVTADHGVAFVPDHASRVPAPAIEPEIAWTPLFIKAPGQVEGAVRDDNALSIDVLPTVAELAGVEIPFEVDGTSLAGDGRRPDDVKPLSGTKPADYPDPGPDGLVRLTADGLAAIEAAPGLPGGDDELRAWGYGRHADLLGRSVSGLGECPAGPAARYRPPDRWATYQRNGGDPLPLWHTGTISAEGARDVAIAVDGTIAGWGVSTPSGATSTFGILLAAPIIGRSHSTPTLYEVTDGADCRLRPLSTTS